MSSRTPNINLVKPSSDENYSVSVFNSNSDTIDTEMATRVKTADIVNNLTSTATNKPLSAAQGKALSDTKANIYQIANGADINTLVAPGIYISPGTVASVSTLQNLPFGLDYPFTMIVTGGGTIAGSIQTIMTNDLSTTRRGISSGWLSWTKLVTGTVQSGLDDSGTAGIRTVTFPHAFPSIPNVIVTPQNSTTPTNWIRACCVTQVSTTGFKYVEMIFNGTSTFGAGTDYCQWVATCL